MYKKSSSDSRNNKSSNSSFRKKDDGGSSGGKRPFKQSDRSGSGEGRPGRPFGAGSDNKSRSGGARDSDRMPSSGGFRSEGKPGADRGGKRPDARPFGERSERRTDDREGKGFKKPYSGDDRGGDAPKRPYSAGSGARGGRPADGGSRSSGYAGKSNSDRPERKPYERKNESGDSDRGRDKPFSERRSPSRDGGSFRDRNDGDRADRPAKSFYDKRDSGGRKDGPTRSGSFGKRDDKGGRPAKRPFTSSEDRAGKKAETPADFYKKRERPQSIAEQRYLEDDNEEWEVVDERKKKRPVAEAGTFPMPLNKYIAHSGECSRRDAAELVKQGKAKVNGELIIDPGHKINEEDKVTLSGKKLIPQKGMVYILLNKPKGFITTTDDPQGRRTVMDLVKNADAGRLYPVGRLDRATTGLILITNDGLLAQKLSHPTQKIKKVYQVTLDKQLTQPHFDKIMEGLELEDGKAIVDEMAFLENKNEVGLEIHSGKNRIVRRIFESLGYEVEKLDRVMYAGLTKKNLPRSKWRFLDEREIVLLKHFKS
jgi:23S rRNA pseudouridine2605 synthase